MDQYIEDITWEFSNLGTDAYLLSAYPIGQIDFANVKDLLDTFGTTIRDLIYTVEPFNNNPTKIPRLQIELERGARPVGSKRSAPVDNRNGRPRPRFD